MNYLVYFSALISILIMKKIEPNNTWYGKYVLLILIFFTIYSIVLSI